MVKVHLPDEPTIETIAVLIHEEYLGDHRGDGNPSHPAMRPWDELTEELRDQNRSQARDNVMKLAELGYRLVPAGSLSGAALTLTTDEVNVLARKEHERWAREKRKKGYRYGNVRCDEPPDLRHPDLVDWDDLDEPTRDQDRRPVQRMAELFARAGLVLAKLDG